MQQIWAYKKLNWIGKEWTTIINTLTAGQKVKDHSLNCVLVNSQMWIICFWSEHISCWLVWRLAVNLAVYTNMECILSRSCVLLWAWNYGSRQLHLCSIMYLRQWQLRSDTILACIKRRSQSTSWATMYSLVSGLLV